MRKFRIVLFIIALFIPSTAVLADLSYNDMKERIIYYEDIKDSCRDKLVDGFSMSLSDIIYLEDEYLEADEKIEDYEERLERYLQEDSNEN